MAFKFPAIAWDKVANVALKIGIYAVGHQAVIEKTIADAASKNVGGLVQDGVQIASGVAQEGK